MNYRIDLLIKDFLYLYCIIKFTVSNSQYHEENAPVEIYNSERSALDSLSCDLQDGLVKPPALLTVDETDVEEVKDFIAKDARRKREEEMQRDDYRTDNNYIDANGLPQPNSQRGDIPSSVIETCDGKLNLFSLYFVDYANIVDTSILPTKVFFLSS